MRWTKCGTAHWDAGKLRFFIELPNNNCRDGSSGDGGSSGGSSGGAGVGAGAGGGAGAVCVLLTGNRVSE